MTAATITIQDQNLGGKVLHELFLKFQTNRISAAELIAERVRQEVAAYNGRAADALSRPAVPAQPILDEVAALGIDLEALAAKLQQDGLAQFEQAFAQMLAPLAD